MNQVLNILTSILLTFYYILEAFVLKFIPTQWRKHKDISKDIALVTGGGSGIGRLLALKLADKGATVVLWDINKKGNEETVKMIKSNGGNACSYVVDVAQRADVYAAAHKVKEDVGTVTILVNNAGIVCGNTLLDTPDAKITKTMDVNAMAHFWTLKAFLPGMLLGNKGHIVTIASLAGHTGINLLTDYCASKFACLGLHESIALEMMHEKRTGIKFTVVCPYYINTGMFDGVKSPMLAILEPDYVADQIFTGILINKEVVLLPPSADFLVALKAMLPYKSMLHLRKLYKLDETMTTFMGRAGKAK